MKFDGLSIQIADDFNALKNWMNVTTGDTGRNFVPYDKHQMHSINQIPGKL